MSDPGDLQARYDDAGERLRAARQSLVEARRNLRPLLGSVTSARARGRINQRIWEIECALGLRTQYFSQSGQDRFLEEKVFHGRTDGRFIEIGGYDGVTGSNCLYFEMFRRWSGLLIEPSPTQFAKAAATRRCECIQVALADREGTAEFLDVREGLTQMSGLTGSYDAGLRAQVEGDPRHKGALVSVDLATLPDLLDQRGWDRVDYISLDVEGGEMAVLSGFPFDRIDVTAWTIENNDAGTAHAELMARHGYRRIEAIGVDDVFVRTST